MREQLIRYLFGELDDDERRELGKLTRRPGAAARAGTICEQCFARNEETIDEPSPPRRLAERTADRIREERRVRGGHVAVGQAGNCGERAIPPAGVGLEPGDLTVAGGVMLAVSMLVFPRSAIAAMARGATVCQWNQHQLWQIFTNFAHDNGGYYPQVYDENAGMAIARLVEAGYVEPADIADHGWCARPLRWPRFKLCAGKAAINVPSRVVLWRHVAR